MGEYPDERRMGVVIGQGRVRMLEYSVIHHDIALCMVSMTLYTECEISPHIPRFRYTLSAQYKLVIISY